MVSKRKKKYTTGEGAQFMSRKQALKKLQLSLNDFRRLCILKGIYPREPRNRKRAQKGDTSIKTLYHVKDIQFLLHEPIIWQLRDFKIFNRKVGRAKAIKDFKTLKQHVQRHPTLTLEHVVKERYPTFADALRDLDDCLTLCFLFSTFPSLPHIPRDQSDLCQRLTLEFQHAVIELKALRKVFISIKGYYYQAEIKGETVTWIVPHHFSFEPQNKAEVDFKLMSIFVEFYTVMLGSVNWRLYHELNLHYPPKFTHLSQSKDEQRLVDEGAYVSERIGALSVPLLRTSNIQQQEEVEEDDFGVEQDPAVIEEAQKIKKLKTLFKGLKIFVSREVPREPVTFLVRCFGGEVSWDSTLFVGSTFDEDCSTITHQIVDRPSIDKKYITRYYVQPQWLFDSVNARQLLPESKYFIGVTLPPHLSPFVDREEKDQQYIPPEERAGYDPDLLEEMHKKDEKAENSDDEDSDEENSDDDEEMDVAASDSDDDEIDADENEESEEEQSNDEKTAAQVDGEKEKEGEEGSDESGTEEDGDEKSPAPPAKNPKGAVKEGQIQKEVPWEKERQERQEYRLREKLVKNKYRKLYKSMMAGRKERAKEIWLLRKKRRLHDEKVKEEMKQKKKLLKEKKKNQNKIEKSRESGSNSESTSTQHKKKKKKVQ